MKLMILWGVPGTGKSTFAGWLRDNKGFTHVDTDAVATGRAKPTVLTQAWEGTYERKFAPAAFIEAIAKHGRPVVAEYGLWANAGNIELLRNLQQRGADPWWFDGYRLAAFAAWHNENPRSRPHLDDGAWQRVVDVINANWQLLEQFYGKERILRTIENGPSYASPEAT